MKRSRVIRLSGLGWITMLMLVTGGASARAGEWVWGGNWTIGIPTSNTAEAIRNASYRGVSLEGRQWRSPSTTLGFSLNWNVFNSREFTTSQVDEIDGAVTGTQFRYLNSWPLFANGHKYWGTRAKMRPYVGLNVGGFVVERRVNVGLYQIQETKWQLGGAPEIGVLFPRGMLLGFFSVRYNYGIAMSDFPAISYVSINLGLGLQ